MPLEYEKVYWSIGVTMTAPSSDGATWAVLAPNITATVHGLKGSDHVANVINSATAYPGKKCPGQPATAAVHPDVPLGACRGAARVVSCWYLKLRLRFTEEDDRWARLLRKEASSLTAAGLGALVGGPAGTTVAAAAGPVFEELLKDLGGEASPVFLGIGIIMCADGKRYVSAHHLPKTSENRIGAPELTYTLRRAEGRLWRHTWYLDVGQWDRATIVYTDPGGAWTNPVTSSAVQAAD